MRACTVGGATGGWGPAMGGGVRNGRRGTRSGKREMGPRSGRLGTTECWGRTGRRGLHCELGPAVGEGLALQGRQRPQMGFIYVIRCVVDWWTNNCDIVR